MEFIEILRIYILLSQLETIGTLLIGFTPLYIYAFIKFIDKSNWKNFLYLSLSGIAIFVTIGYFYNYFKYQEYLEKKIKYDKDKCETLIENAYLNSKEKLFRIYYRKCYRKNN